MALFSSRRRPNEALSRIIAIVGVLTCALVSCCPRVMGLTLTLRPPAPVEFIPDHAPSVQQRFIVDAVLPGAPRSRATPYVYQSRVLITILALLLNYLPNHLRGVKPPAWRLRKGQSNSHRFPLPDSHQGLNLRLPNPLLNKPMELTWIYGISTVFFRRAGCPSKFIWMRRHETPWNVLYGFYGFDLH